ncbi:MAG: glycosyltransferase family 2 protein, partial [Nanoarchaeota archaeon]
MNKKPKVSVLMPAYNSQDYISDAIESILSQTYTDFEFVIIDDCSTDDTWKIIKKYAKNDKRIKAFKNVKNSGVTVSLNNGLEKCSGDYIARMDSDDVSLPKRLEKQVEVLENGKADVVGTNIYFIDEQGKVFGKRKYEPVTGKIIKLESPLAH